jgi:hypothetical protein
MWKLVLKKWLELISQHKKNYAFAIFNQFIVSLSAPALTHSISTTFIEYKCQPPPPGRGGGGPSCSAKLNLLCKNGPKRKSWGENLNYQRTLRTLKFSLYISGSCINMGF